jgi:plasmid rolling circle replication initiator protein Rep
VEFLFIKGLRHLGEGEKVEFTNEKLDKMSEKKLLTNRNAQFIEWLYAEQGKKHNPNSDQPPRWERMRDCLNFWAWDAYHENKLLDLQRVNRCKDRFCPNCRTVSLAKAIIDFAPAFQEMRRKGYNPYLMTLTVPNCSASELRTTISKMQKAFSKFWRWYNCEIGKNGYRYRLFHIPAAIRFLEITKNHDENTFHPHWHLIVFLDGNENPDNFRKIYQGEWSNKRQEFNMLSDADLQIRNMWYRAYNCISVRKDCNDQYKCDIREMQNENGIYEVFKYVTKDSDIATYTDFKTVYLAIHGKRLRQGYGELFNIQLEPESEEDGKKEDVLLQYLSKKKDESPERLITTLNNLMQEYMEYRKISRYKISEIMGHIDNEE